MGTVEEGVIAREGARGGWGRGGGVQISGMYSYSVQTDAMDDVGS